MCWGLGGRFRGGGFCLVALVVDPAEEGAEHRHGGGSEGPTGVKSMLNPGQQVTDAPAPGGEQRGHG